MSGSHLRALVRTTGGCPRAPCVSGPAGPGLIELRADELRHPGPQGSRLEPRRPEALRLALPPGPAPQARAETRLRPPAPRQPPPSLCLPSRPVCKAASCPSRRIGSCSPKATHAEGQDTPCWVFLIFNGKPLQVLSPVPALSVCFVLQQCFYSLPSF